MCWTMKINNCAFLGLFVFVFFTYVGVLISYVENETLEIADHLINRLVNQRRTKPVLEFRHVRWLDTGNNTELCPDVTMNSRFAFVNYMVLNKAIKDDVRWYVISAVKLAQSILFFTKKYDLIMMVALEDNMALSDWQLDIILNSGWQICYVESIGSSLNYNNRFHSAKIYTKLNVWRLKEYEAVVSIDSDMYAVGDPSYLFEQIWPDMVANNYTIGMGLDYPTQGTKRTLFNYVIGKCIPVKSHFNGGIFIVKPSEQTFTDLIRAIDTTDYDIGMCEQGLLNSFFKDRTYTLPYSLNVNMVTKACIPDLYYGSNKTFLHFTVAKPGKTSLLAMDFMWTCPWWEIEDECQMWVKQSVTL